MTFCVMMVAAQRLWFTSWTVKVALRRYFSPYAISCTLFFRLTPYAWRYFLCL